MKRFCFLCFFFFQFGLLGCAYRFGLSERSLPGGYKEVSIPVFKNLTQQVGVEMFYTNALVRSFSRSQVARLTDKADAPLVLEGTITRIDTSSGGAITHVADQGAPNLPENAVLTADYRLNVTVGLVLRRKSDDKIVWQGSFMGEKVYNAPRILTAGVNSADATYNQSVRMQKFSELATEMMAEAHNRMTENF